MCSVKTSFNTLPLSKYIATMAIYVCAKISIPSYKNSINMRRSINESLENHKVFVMWIGLIGRNLYTTPINQYS